VTEENKRLRESIRSVPDFPKQGIVFRDITTLLKDPEALREAGASLLARYRHLRIDKVAAIESRGFILGGILAEKLGVGFVPIRKPGKLPAAVARKEYSLEYGTDALEIHRDAIRPGERVLLHDDLLATGGTAKAACSLIEELGGVVVGVAFLIELQFLAGRDALRGYDVYSLVQYGAER
jgi:adenine phosphoribosyltransferase